jgi:NAD(P)-dependent dehydrogenase (short-subunit alcohol dehydrogenase family)
MSAAKRIVVTGASRGLGRAMTVGFIARGHYVYGCSRSAAAADSWEGKFPQQGRFDAVDVADDAAVAAWAKTVIDDGGPPDLLINNAALMNEPTELWNIKPEDFRDLTNVNINGMFHVLRHFLPAMIERSSGVIVNLSSGWGRSTSPKVAPYCATKWAVEGLTRALAQELPRGMAAVPLNPGVIDTDMLRSCWGDTAGSYPNAESWAKRAVPFLLDLDASHNGNPLTVPM